MKIVPRESRTTNYKENIYRSFPAIKETIIMLFTKPSLTMPYALGYGFELRDFLFKTDNSPEFQASKEELQRQMQSILEDEDVSTNINMVDTVVVIAITYTNEDGIKETLDIPVAEYENGNLIFKDIIIR